MKIIRKGKAWWVNERFKCGGCATVFELEEVDRPPCILPNGERYQYCPVCGIVLYLSAVMVKRGR